VILGCAAERAAVAQCSSCTSITTRYVRIGGNNACSGQCWAEAFESLEFALAEAAADDDITLIKIAGGTYRPSAPNGSFVIERAVTIEGGYAGTGEFPDARNICEPGTILSGDIGENDDPEDPDSLDDNSAHVIVIATTDGIIRFDGLKVTAGNGLVAGPQGDRAGGGMFVPDGSIDSRVEVRNCVFFGNRADGGGAIHATRKILIRDSHFIGNAAVPCGSCGLGSVFSTGGALSLVGDGQPEVVHCLFESNAAVGHGGAVFIDFVFASEPPEETEELEDIPESRPFWFTSCVFRDNVAGQGILTGDGGAIIVYDAADLRATNCIFTGNSAKGPEGAIGLDAYARGQIDQIWLKHCTMVGNSTESLCCGGVNMSTGRIENSIVVGNLTGEGVGCTTFYDPDLCDQIGSVNPEICIIQHSCVSGVGSLWPDLGNIDADPLFVNASGGDFRLSLGSPAVDAGDEALVPVDRTDVNDDMDLAEDLPWDSRRNLRVIGCGPDMGAHEFGRCIGDANGDGSVNGGDITVLLGNWGECESTPCLGDLTCDGEVGGADLALVIGNWGACPVLPVGPCFEIPIEEESQSRAMSASSGLTPAMLMQLFGFESVEAFTEWLSGLGFETMSSILELLDGE